METSHLLCDNHVVRAVFFSGRHAERVKLFEHLIGQIHPKKYR